MTSFAKKVFIGGTAALTLAGAVAASSAPAQAQWHRGGGGAVAAGVIGGLAAGAIAGSIASQHPYYAPAPVYEGGCYWARRPMYNEYGEFIGHRRVRVCE